MSDFVAVPGRALDVTIQAKNWNLDKSRDLLGWEMITHAQAWLITQYGSPNTVNGEVIP